MWDIFILQWKRLIKQPFLIIMFLGMSVVFVYFLSGMGQEVITVETYSENMTDQELEDWIDRLNEEDSLVFVASDSEEVEEQIRTNESTFALVLEEDSYSYLANREDANLSVVDQHVQKIFRTESRINEVESANPDIQINVSDYLQVETSALTEEATDARDYQIYVLAGMTFYFSIFSILYLMTNLVEEKRLGTWNRLIFSPLSKTKIYLGQLFHYFLAGIVQIVLSFLILIWITGANLGSNYLSVAAVVMAFTFSIVALGMLLMGIIQSPQQLQVIIPIITTSMAMLGGAFWPLDIVENPVLLFLADLMPIRYGVMGMTQAVLEQHTLGEMLRPIGILLLMGVFFMGIGINLMERASES